MLDVESLFARDMLVVVDGDDEEKMDAERKEGGVNVAGQLSLERPARQAYQSRLD